MISLIRSLTFRYRVKLMKTAALTATIETGMTELRMVYTISFPLYSMAMKGVTERNRMPEKRK